MDGNGLASQLQIRIGLSSRRSRVQVLSAPPEFILVKFERNRIKARDSNTLKGILDGPFPAIQHIPPNRNICRTAYPLVSLAISAAHISWY